MACKKRGKAEDVVFLQGTVPYSDIQKRSRHSRLRVPQVSKAYLKAFNRKTHTCPAFFPAISRACHPSRQYCGVFHRTLPQPNQTKKTVTAERL
jgi:hypothetical protein